MALASEPCSSSSSFFCLPIKSRLRHFFWVFPSHSETQQQRLTLANVASHYIIWWVHVSLSWPRDRQTDKAANVRKFVFISTTTAVTVQYTSSAVDSFSLTSPSSSLPERVESLSKAQRRRCRFIAMFWQQRRRIFSKLPIVFAFYPFHSLIRGGNNLSHVERLTRIFPSAASDRHQNSCGRELRGDEEEEEEECWSPRFWRGMQRFL